MAADVYQDVNALSEEILGKLMDRLEFRGADPALSSWVDTYLASLSLSGASRVLDVGYGTGVVMICPL